MLNSSSTKFPVQRLPVFISCIPSTIVHYSCCRPRCCTIIVKHINRVIVTICEGVVSDNPLTGRKENVRGDEPAGSRIIVAALEIVPASFVVVNIAAITERLICTTRVCQAARCGNELAPTVIGIFYHGIPAAVNQFDDIPLRIAEIVVDIARAGAHLVNYSHKVARCVIGEPLLDRCTAASRDHVHEHGAVVVVFGIGAVYYLAQTQAVLVVGIGVGMRTVGDGGQLLVLPCERLSQIARGIAHSVIRDGLTVRFGVRRWFS